jgi:PAS domain S-box-containing protein
VSLRAKTVIVIAIAAVIVVGVVFAISQFIFMRSFQSLETTDTNLAVQQVTSALSDQINSLNKLNHDWAAWDDTYNFVQNPSENIQYIEVNPTDTTFSSAGLNYIFIINNAGSLVFGKAFDLEGNKEIPIPDNLIQNFFNTTILNHDTVEDSISGIMLLPEGPLLVSSQPIITSQGQGPIMGTIIMAQYLDATVIDTLSKTAHLPLDVVTIDDKNIPSEYKIALSSFSVDNPVFTHASNSKSIEGYTLLNDIYGKPALIVKTTIPRDVYAKGTSTMRYLLIALLIMAVLLSVLLYYALGKLVIARVGLIGRYVSDIGRSANLTKRLPTEGDDELSILSRKINDMVDTLQKSEQTLQIKQQAEEKLRLTIESVVEGIATTDLDGTITDVNESKVLIHGFSSREELIGKNVLDLIVEEDRSKAQEALKRTLESGFSGSGEYTMLKKDGSKFFGERLAAVLKNPDGKSIGFVISTRDITTHRQAEVALKLSEQNFRNSLNNSPMGITIADLEFNSVYANQTFLDIFGYENLDQVKAMPPQEYYTPRTYAEYLLRKEQRSRGERNPDNIEIEVIRKDGTIRHLQIFLKSVLWDGKIQYQTLYNDVTERKEATDQLAKLNEELKTFNSQLETKVQERTKQFEEAVGVAEASNRAKSEFLASMSHELRTPLNAIIGFSEVLRERYFGELNEKQAEYIVDIVDSGKHLLSLINDILDLSKIEAGKMDLDISEVKIADLLQNSLVMIKEKALAHNLGLDLQIAENINGTKIKADERRLKQVMFNLLSNSAKFTPDGGEIRVMAKKEGETLIISVSDTGIGMTVQEQKRLFEAFYQASGGIKGKTPGTGLGLAITRSIVEKHGGKIWMESGGTNKGSRFTFTLPI